MRKYLLLGFSLILSINGFSQRTSAWNLFNDGWEFIRDADTVVSLGLFNKSSRADLKWDQVTLPHTAHLEPKATSKVHWQGICIYRKFFKVPAADQNRRLAVYFEAGMQVADIYLNGKLIGHHDGGYLPFEADITGIVKNVEENCLVVRLDNRDNPRVPPGKPIKALDFNYYSGLYRNVYLVAQDKLHFTDAVASNRQSGGVATIHCEDVRKESAKIVISSEIRNDHPIAKTAGIRWTLTNPAGDTVSGGISEPAEMAPGTYRSFHQQFVIDKPNLWSTVNPYLYTLSIEILNEGNIIEKSIVRTGIRAIRFTNGAFYLNDAKLRIRGTNRHQEYPYVGNAVPDAAQYRDAWKIKNAGFNFVRCSHYPQSPAFLDACDELGIMVMNSTPGWQFVGNEIFQQNSFQNIRDMVRRDRNHPSIILWEASLNESGMPKSYMEAAHRIVHEELPFKDIYTCGWIPGIYDVFVPARQHAKAPDYWSLYSGSQPLLVAEYGDWEYYAQNAGFNQTAFANLKESERSSRQLRGDGEVRLLQQALNYQESFNDNFRGNLAGDANWLMFDYNRGYAPDIESSGIMDIMRLPKFSYYFYQSQYGPLPDSAGFGKPMVFIANFHEKSSPKEVKVFSNCEEVEIFLNGKTIARQKPDNDKFSGHLAHPPFTFKLSGFEPGMLEATGYINGMRAAETWQFTPRKAKGLEIRADCSGKEPVAGQPDLIFLYVSVVDSKVTLMARDSSSVFIKVTGPAVLLGENPVRAEAGIAAFLLRTDGNPGTVGISAEAAGINPATGSILIQPGIAAVTQADDKNRVAGYPAGDYELMNFLATNIRYPVVAIRGNNTGRVYVNVVVDSLGNPKKVSVLKGVHWSIDDEAVRVVKLIPKWRPALRNGLPVESTLTIPVKFQMKIVNHPRP